MCGCLEVVAEELEDMLSVRSSPHRLHQRNRLFAPSAKSYSLKISHDEGE